MKIYSKLIDNDTILGKIEDKIMDSKLCEPYLTIYRFLSKCKDIIYRNPKNFLNNIITYRKFLTNDHWWDHHYLFSMLREKLYNDKIKHQKYGICENQKIINDLDYCIKLLNEIIKDEYDEKHLYYHDLKWGQLNPYIDENNRWHSNRKYVKTEQDEIQESKEFFICIDNASKERQYDIQKLFIYISNNILNWWD